MQHSGRASFGYSFTERAGALATYGKRGEHKCERHVGVPVGRDPHNGRRGSKRARGGERAGIGASGTGGGGAAPTTDSGPGGGGPTHFGGTLLAWGEG